MDQYKFYDPSPPRRYYYPVGVFFFFFHFEGKKDSDFERDLYAEF